MVASQLWGSIEDLSCRYRKSGSISHHPSNRIDHFTCLVLDCRKSDSKGFLDWKTTS